METHQHRFIREAYRYFGGHAVSRSVWLVGSAAIAAGGIGALAPEYLRLVASLGGHIPEARVAQDYVIAIGWAAVLGLGIVIWPVPVRDRSVLLWVWAAKIAVTLGFMLWYEARYPALDAYSYFAGGHHEDFLLSGAGLGDGTQNIVALTWVLTEISPASYHAVKVSFSMVGLIAIYLFYRSAALYCGTLKPRVLLGLAMFPSILFWSSILGKEPIILLGIALYTLGVVGWFRKEKIPYLLATAVGLSLAGLIRPWMLPIMGLPLLPTFPQNIPKGGARIIVAGLLGVGALLSLFYVADRFDIDGMSRLIAAANTMSQAWAAGGSGQELAQPFNSFWDLIAFVPRGAFTALFRPLPGEVPNLFGWLAGIENLLLLSLAALAIARIRWRDLSDPVVLWALLFIGVWAAVYGFVSYQNLGTAVRFKAQILPVMLALLVFLGRPRIALGRE